MASRKRNPEKRTVKDAMPADVFVQHIDAETKEQAITELLNVLVIHGALDLEREEAVRQQILDREAVASTGIGNGVAIPHAKNKFAKHMAVAVGLSERGIEFGAHDQIPAFVVILWVCDPKSTPEHLALMRGIATVARDPNQSGRLQNVRDKKTLLAFLEEIPVEDKK